MANGQDLIFNCLCYDGRGYNKLSSMNKISFQMFFLFLSISVSRFKWTGLPKEIKPYQLEKVVNLYGQGVFFKIGDQHLVCSFVNSGDLDIYGESMKGKPLGINGVSFPELYVKRSMVTLAGKPVVREQEGVLIRNNIYSVPTYALIKPYVEKLCFIWESMGINAGLSRVVALIHANKDLSGTIRSEIGKILGSTPSGVAIVNDKTNILEKIEKLDFKVEYQPDKYWTDFDNTFNKICEIVGITCDMNKNKKERVVVAQVESNDELTTIVEDTYLEFRKIASEEINELFGLSTKVENKNDIKVTNPNEQASIEKTTPPQE